MELILATIVCMFFIAVSALYLGQPSTDIKQPTKEEVLLSMRIGDEYCWDWEWDVTRVPGGWIFNGNKKAVFVPKPDEDIINQTLQDSSVTNPTTNT